MAEFIVEAYLSRETADAFARDAKRLRLAADELSRDGTRVRYLRRIFVPEDETCFYLYEAASADAVREAAMRAALPYERVAEALSKP